MRSNPLKTVRASRADSQHSHMTFQSLSPKKRRCRQVQQTSPANRVSRTISLEDTYDVAIVYFPSLIIGSTSAFLVRVLSQRRFDNSQCRFGMMYRRSTREERAEFRWRKVMKALDRWQRGIIYHTRRNLHYWAYDTVRLCWHAFKQVLEVARVKRNLRCSRTNPEGKRL